MADTVLVTGGAGYVGSHVVVELARAGYAPVILDNFVNSTPAIRPRLEALAGRPVACITADVREVAALRAAFHDHPITAVVHCAGLKAIAESEERPLAYYDVNVGGALALSEVMGEAGVATFVFGSSAAVYGQPAELPTREDAPLTPHNVYGRTKRVVEDFLRDLARANPNWRIGILRYFNPAGAHSTAMLGEFSRGRPQNLVPLLCRLATGEDAELTVYGTDWPTADGTCIRDYVHVQDVAEAHVATLRYLVANAGATTLNVGSGRGHSVLEVIAAFEAACGRRLARTLGPRRAGDVGAYYANPARAQDALGWQSTRSLEAICSDAWRWHKNRGR